MNNGNGVSRGDRNRNAGLFRPSPKAPQVADAETLVGVTGIEPAASSSRTGNHCSLRCR